MRCAFESRQEQLTIYPFPGLKVINIRGSNLLALDLITIGSFVSRLSDNNRLLELSMRDYPLDETGLRGLLPCLPLVRTVTLCARRLRDPANYVMIGDAVGDPRSRLRELWLLEVPANSRGLCDCPPASLYTCGRCDDVLPPDELGKAINVLSDACRNNNVRLHVWSFYCPFTLFLRLLNTLFGWIQMNLCRERNVFISEFSRLREIDACRKKYGHFRVPHFLRLLDIV